MYCICWRGGGKEETRRGQWICKWHFKILFWLRCVCVCVCVCLLVCVCVCVCVYVCYMHVCTCVLVQCMCTWKPVSNVRSLPLLFSILLFDTGSHIVQAGCVAKAHLELFSLKCLALQSHTITPNLSFLIPQVPDKAICLSTYVPERWEVCTVACSVPCWCL